MAHRWGAWDMDTIESIPAVANSEGDAMSTQRLQAIDDHGPVTDLQANLAAVLGDITTLTWRTEAHWNQGLSAEDRTRVLQLAREAIALLDGRLTKRIGQP